MLTNSTLYFRHASTRKGISEEKRYYILMNDYKDKHLFFLALMCADESSITGLKRFFRKINGVKLDFMLSLKKRIKHEGKRRAGGGRERYRGMMLTQFLYMVLGEMPAERQKDKIPEIRNDRV